MNRANVTLAFLGIVAVCATWICAAFIMSGYVLTILWGWFVVPTFGAPKLAVPPAIGILLIVAYLTHPPHSIKKMKFWYSVRHGLVYTVVRPALALLVGWIVQMFT